MKMRRIPPALAILALTLTGCATTDAEAPESPAPTSTNSSPSVTATASPTSTPEPTPTPSVDAATEAPMTAGEVPSYVDPDGPQLADLRDIDPAILEARGLQPVIYYWHPTNGTMCPEGQLYACEDYEYLLSAVIDSELAPPTDAEIDAELERLDEKYGPDPADPETWQGTTETGEDWAVVGPPPAAGKSSAELQQEWADQQGY